MTSKKKSPCLVVLQLSGGSDALNTIVPYGDGLYYDFRPNIGIGPEQVIPIDEHFGFNQNMGPIKKLWDQGKVAIINGIGYDNPVRSHFRSMDIWHSAEPDKMGTEGWLGRAIRDLDPKAENVLTGVNFGRGLPRALGCKGVPVASVGDLETYGLFPDVRDEWVRRFSLEAFAKMYGGQAQDAVLDFLGQTGNNALKGADILRTAPAQYSSSIEYAPSGIAQSLKNAAQVMFADLGTRIYYTQHGNFDTHSGEAGGQGKHPKLWHEVSQAVGDFYSDLEEHGRDEDVLIFLFTEFGRRIRDNGSGSDHGSGGTAFVIGGAVKGGWYGEYPSLKEEQQLDGDLQFNNDFRCSYSTILERWLGLEAAQIVNGHFEQFEFITS